MEELIKTFHIDIKLLTAQAINFAIVLFVLYKFAYKPLLKHMDERSRTIEKGLEDAKKAREEFEKAEQEREDRIKEAKKGARQILEDAQKQAEKNKGEIVEQAKSEAEKVVLQAKSQIQSEKEKMLLEVKKEIGQLVVVATQKVVGDGFDSDKDSELIKKTISEMEN